MMPEDIAELQKFFTEIENLTSNPVIQAKCQEAKTYIMLLEGALLSAPEFVK